MPLDVATLNVPLPRGWTEQPRSAGLPREFWANDDQSRGVLHVSVFSDEDTAFVSRQDDLSEVAEALGKGFAARGENWGTAASRKCGTLDSVRYGLAMFWGGEFPAMFVWVTLLDSVALMWTWLGPDPTADEVAASIRIILGSSFPGA